MKSISQILRAEKKQFNILCACTHERYETGLAKTGHNFYAIHDINHIKNWNTTYAPIPNNYVLLDCRNGIHMPTDVDFDLVLSQNKFSQFQTLQPIAKDLGIPVVSLEHTVPPPNSFRWTMERARMRGHKNVFITEYSIPQWKFEDDENASVIYHCVDTDLFKPLDQFHRRICRILTVGNDIINRDMFLNSKQQFKVTQDLPHIHVGDTPGYSEAAKDTQELADFYANSRIFLNTHHVSPVPTSLLEAASAGCAIVSCNTCGIPEIFTDGYDCLLVDTDEEMRAALEELIQDEERAMALGNRARQTILEKCNTDRFVKDWNEIFESVI